MDEIMLFNATFDNISSISWRSVLLVEKTGIPRENHRLAASHCQTLWHKVVAIAHSHMGFELTTLVVIDTDCISGCKSNYHTITITMAP